MTIQTETNKVVYVIDDATSTLTIPFYFFDKQIAVYKADYDKIPCQCNYEPAHNRQRCIIVL